MRCLLLVGSRQEKMPAWTPALPVIKCVTKAAREFLRISELKPLKSVSGKVDFDLDWEELESLELGEVGFPD